MRKKVLKPQDTREIQVVCGLIEEEHIRTDKDSSSKGDSHSPTTREIGGGVVDGHLTSKAHCNEGGKGTRFITISLDQVELVVHLDQTIHGGHWDVELVDAVKDLDDGVGTVFRRRRHALRDEGEDLFFTLEKFSFNIGVEDSLQRGPLIRSKVLGDVESLEVFREVLEMARGDTREEGGLANSITANEGIMMSWIEGEVGAVEEEVFASDKAHADVGDTDLTRGVSKVDVDSGGS